MSKKVATAATENSMRRHEEEIFLRMNQSQKGILFGVTMDSGILILYSSTAVYLKSTELSMLKGCLV